MSEKLEKVRTYLRYARETRALASNTPNPKDRDSLFNLAEEFDRLARELEAVQKTEDIFRQIDVPQERATRAKLMSSSRGNPGSVIQPSTGRT